MALLALPISTSIPDSYRDLLARLNAHWNEKNLEECALEFRTALQEARNSEITGYERSLNFALILAFSARTHCQQKRIAECASALKEAEQVLKTITDSPASLQLAWLLERARLSVAERTPSQARTAYAEAWTIAIAVGDEDASVEIAEMMAEIEPIKTRISWIEKGIALALAAKSEIPKRRLAALYRAQGQSRHELHRYEDAMESFEKSGQAAKKSQNLKAELLAESAKGKTLRIMNRTADALELQMKLLQSFDARGERTGEVYEEIAECLQTLKRTEEAESYFALAYHQFATDPDFDDQRPQLLKRLKALGKVKNQ